jgi:hypothetical protein
MSYVVNFLTPYRADGRTSVMPNGSIAVPAESWLKQSPRVPGLEGNDCDGTCLQIKNILSFVASSPPEIRKTFPFISAFYNVLTPHYQVGVSVLGAASAEASGHGGGGGHGGDEPAKQKTVAGHAVALLVPTMAILTGLYRGSKQTIQGVSLVDAAIQDDVAEARFEAMYENHRGAMGEEERAAFSTWKTAKDGINSWLLEPFGMEGTTPASPVLFKSGDDATKARSESMRDGAAFSKVGANIGRSLKILYAGRADDDDQEDALRHEFYSEFVELTLGRTNPLWKSPKLRDLGVACTQLVFSKHDGVTENAEVQMAGTTPKELVEYHFAMVPLVVSDKQSADILDFAGVVADGDVMPPRPQGKHKLTQFQTTSLESSLACLADLNVSFQTKMEEAGDDADDADVAGGGDVGDQVITFIVPISSLVNNPRSVLHFTERLKAVSTRGEVVIHNVEGLFEDVFGRAAGKFCVINVAVLV